MANRIKLKVEKRTIEGKKVKKLRRDGIMPANVYGPEFKSQSVQVPYADFEKVFSEAGETRLVDLALGEQIIPVLIHNIHTDLRNHPLHADFYKVNLKEKVKAMIPIEFIGEASAVTEKIGLLEKVMSEVEVEALPTELPEKVEVQVQSLAQIDQQITVGDLKFPQGVDVLSDPGQVIVKVGELITKEAQEELEAEAAAAEAAKAESAEATETAEGEGIVAEGAQKEEEKSESPKEGIQGEAEQKKEEEKA